MVAAGRDAHGEGPGRGDGLLDALGARGSDPEGIDGDGLAWNAAIRQPDRPFQHPLIGELHLHLRRLPWFDLDGDTSVLVTAGAAGRDIDLPWREILEGEAARGIAHRGARSLQGQA